MIQGLFAVYMCLVILAGMWAGSHANDTDEEGNFKVQWRIILVFGMFVLSPVVAKLCGLC